MANPTDGMPSPKELLIVEETMPSPVPTSTDAGVNQGQYSVIVTSSPQATPHTSPYPAPQPISDPITKILLNPTVFDPTGKVLVDKGTQMTPGFESSLMGSPYHMQSENRGTAAIFNHEVFHPSLKLTRREGTEADVASLKKAFQLLGFKSENIHRHDDLTVELLREEMNRYARQTDYSNMDCVFVAILTHGNEGGIVYGSDGPITLDKLLRPFKEDIHPTLVGKPKVFIVQACRGGKADDGVELPPAVETDIHNLHQQRIPVEADFLCSYSTAPGYVSFRRSEGSHFIQSLTRKITEKKSRAGLEQKLDFLQLLVDVCKDVSKNFESYVPSRPELHGKKQAPCLECAISKRILL
ncbi:hypothetical protein RvY_15216 [Ramazzottius varieornatus]|uniref:Caspase family p20 domain-containing protein n=1 Tax=Ramazzottius varieornatus TaxID=947166 RepID=A0A1D1VYX1_RAMVA|nr:hypothetical protein RvY_15216 [Ramazzottius varieornatus]